VEAVSAVGPLVGGRRLSGRHQLLGRLQLAAQVLQLADARYRGVDAAPAHAGTIRDRPDQRQAALLTGQSTDHLHSAPALTESPLEQVGVANTFAMLHREVEMSGQRAEIVEQAVDRPRIAGPVLAFELSRPRIRDRDSLLVGRRLDAI